MINTKYHICSRCVIDSNVPGAKFDDSGECSYCKIHDQLEKSYPLDDKSEARLNRLVDRIKKTGKDNKYDCIVGISGGRDSIYTLYLTKKLGLRPLAVHFNDGFGNPVAGQNMKRATDKLGVELITITSDWRESKDLKIAFLKASVPDLEEATDIGIETALYGVAVQKGIKFLISGYSFRTEGICPLEWNYLDGAYLKSVHKKFGTVPLRKWKPEDPGFNLEIPHIFYYTFVKGITAVPLLNYVNYIRSEGEELIKRELGWVYPGSKYYDDLYQSLMTYMYRVKFKIERRRYFYSALIRSGQMSREAALEDIEKNDVIEDPDVIKLCMKRLGLTKEDFEHFMKAPLKTFRDYPTGYRIIRLMRIPIRVLSWLNILPGITYDKYFKCV